jgi:hypothetical protein
MASRRIADALEAGRRCVETMRQNASYIEGELPRVSLPDDLRSRVAAACTDLAAAADRVSGALDEAGSLATLAADVGGIQLALIVASVHAETVKMHQVVLALRAAAATDGAHWLSNVLVEESAAKFLWAYSQFRDAVGIHIH